MKAIILVGGEGTRLRPLTLHCLKSMAPMAGRPFLEYQMDYLRRYGVREVVLSICHLPELIKQAYGDGKRHGIKIHYAIETQPLGTAGAIKNAEEFISGKDPVVVLNGDILTNIDLSRMLALHRQHHALATLSLTQVQDPSAYGLVRRDEHSRILSFIEKPGQDETHSPWVNAGVYLFEPDIFKYIPAGENYSAERALFPQLLAGGERVWGFSSQGYWMDIGTLARYHQAHQDILEGRMLMLPVGKPWKRQEGIRAGLKCEIHADAELCSPLVLGDRCRLESGARMLHWAVLGNGVQVGKHAEIERSILWDDVVIGEQAKLHGCVLGRGCKIGRFAQLSPGTVLGDHAVIPDYSKL